MQASMRAWLHEQYSPLAFSVKGASGTRPHIAWGSSLRFF